MEPIVNGATAIGAFIREEGATMADLIDHVEHAIDLVGVDHVGLGFDFLSYMAKYRWSEERAQNALTGHPDGLEDDAEVANLGTALLDRGFSRSDVERMMHDNFARVFADVLPS